MGQYKVPQDVEAEDKIIGPLTFKQFLYAIIGVVWAALCFFFLHTLPAVMIIVGVPPATLFLLLAFYKRDGQNFEQLLIAMVGFFSQARRRLWTKEEIVESFHVEPKPVELEQSQRSSTEVRGELDKLASMIDSRGWNEPQPASLSTLPSATPTRLVAPPAPTETADETGADMLDLQQSPLAQNLAQMLQEASNDVRDDAIEHMTAKPLRATQISTSVTTPPANDILKLATERDDLTVSQIAATATRMVPLPEGQSVNLRHDANTSQ